MNQDFRRKRPAYGFPFLDAKATRELEEKSRHAQGLLQAAGYERVMPPALDFPETFAVFESYDSFRLRDRLGEDLSLRSDVTVQIMKGFANLFARRELPQKIYYTVPVYRDIRRSYPSLREVWQVGAECIGLKSEQAIPELIRLALRIMDETFQIEFALLVSDIRALLAFERWLHNDSLRDSLVNRNAPRFAAMMSAQSIGTHAANELARLLLYPPVSAVDFHVQWQALRDNLPATVVTTCEQCWEEGRRLVASLGDPRVVFEPLLASKTFYYSGLFFEGYVPSLTQPPVRGGAYSELLREYSEMNLPAAGFAVDLSSLTGIR